MIHPFKFSYSCGIPKPFYMLFFSIPCSFRDKKGVVILFGMMNRGPQEQKKKSSLHQRLSLEKNKVNEGKFEEDELKMKIKFLNMQLKFTYVMSFVLFLGLAVGWQTGMPVPFGPVTQKSARERGRAIFIDGLKPCPIPPKNECGASQRALHLLRLKIKFFYVGTCAHKSPQKMVWGRYIRGCRSKTLVRHTKKCGQNRHIWCVGPVLPSLSSFSR